MKVKIILIIILIFLCNLAGAATRLTPTLRQLSEKGKLRFYQEAMLSPLEIRDGKTCIDVFVEGNVDVATLRNLDCRVGSTIGKFTTLSVPIDKLQQIAELSGVERILPSYRDEPLLDQSTSNSMSGSNYLGCNADSVQALGVDGNGVILGIIDYYPINWKHQDFYETDWTSSDLRVINIWNQNDDTGTPPFGFSYGTEYSKSDLNGDNGPATAGGNHGTSCTGIAAGDGSAGNKTGMAPGSGIIYIHKRDASTSVQDAIAYIESRADALNKPAVISFSGGSKYGYHDGTDPISQAFDSFCDVGKMAVVACGNYYTTTDHALGTGTSTNIEIKIDSANYTANTDYINIPFYFKSGDNFDVTVTSPGDTAYICTVSQDSVSHNTSYGKLYIERTSDPSIQVIITDESGTTSIGDIWTIDLTATATPNGGKWTAWIYEANGFEARFQTYNSGEKTLNIYASGNECIAAGAHDKSNGGLTGSSSAGTTMDGRIKPEVTAPSNVSTPNNTDSTSYGTLGATSAAAPHVAGAIALLFQRYPDATPDEIKTYLTDNAFTDDQTAAQGVEPNVRYGYGKLNTKGAYDATPYQDTTTVSGIGNYTFQFDTETGAPAIAGIQVTATGTLTNLSVVKHIGATPPNLPGGAKALQNWFDINASGSGYTCNLTLYYTDEELSNAGFDDPAASEGRLELYRYDGTWQRMGATSRDTTNNSVTLDGVTQFSDWALGDPQDSPLPIELSDFYAEVVSGGIELHWSTATEVNNAGFNLYRKDGDLPGFRNLEGLIQGAGITTEPQKYRFLDTEVQPDVLYTYQLSDVEECTGKETFHPEITVIATEEELESKKIPSSYKLHANYPNPFNPKTTIKFDLPQNSATFLQIYNATGNLVKILVDRPLEAGYHIFVWDGKDEAGKAVGSGVYFYRIEAGIYKNSKKMILLR